MTTTVCVCVRVCVYKVVEYFIFFHRVRKFTHHIYLNTNFRKCNYSDISFCDFFSFCRAVLFVHNPSLLRTLLHTLLPDNSGVREEQKRINESCSFRHFPFARGEKKSPQSLCQNQSAGTFVVLLEWYLLLIVFDGDFHWSR